MKITRLEKLFITVLMIIFGGIVLHAPLSVGLGTLFPDYSLLIKSWKEILILGLTPVAAIIITKHHLWHELLRDWLFRAIAAYALLYGVLSVVLYQGAAATAAGLAIDLRYILFFCLVYIAIKVLPQYRTKMLQIAVVGACVVVGFATLQLFLPPDILTHIGYGKDTIAPYLTVDKNTDYIRVNSTLRGPNPLGAYAGMTMAILAAALAHKKLQLQNKKVLAGVVALAICSVVALWISYSRSALVAGLGMVVVVVVATLLKNASRRTWLIISACIIVIAGVLVLARDSSVVSNVLLHENPSGGSQVSSNDDHVKSLESGWRGLVTHPFGLGVGSAGSASLYGANPSIVENHYLFVAHETGWLGLLLFLAVFIIVMARLWKGRSSWLNLGVFASGLGIAFIGVLLPVWADDTVAIVWWGLAAIALANKEIYDRK